MEMWSANQILVSHQQFVKKAIENVQVKFKWLSIDFVPLYFNDYLLTQINTVSV